MIPWLYPTRWYQIQRWFISDLWICYTTGLTTARLFDFRAKADLKMSDRDLHEQRNQPTRKSKEFRSNPTRTKSAHRKNKILTRFNVHWMLIHWFSARADVHLVVVHLAALPWRRTGCGNRHRHHVCSSRRRSMVGGVQRRRWRRWQEEAADAAAAATQRCVMLEHLDQHLFFGQLRLQIPYPKEKLSVKSFASFQYLI